MKNPNRARFPLAHTKLAYPWLSPHYNGGAMTSTATAASPPPDPNTWPRRLVTLGLLTAIVGSSAPIPLYPIFRQTLQLDASTMTLIFVAYIVGVLAALLSMGQVMARLANPYRLLAPALVTVALGALLMASANSLAWLVLGRLLAGLGTGAVTVAANSALVELTPGNPRRAALLSSLSFGAGSALGPILTGVLLQLQLWPLVLPFVAIATSASLALITAIQRWNSHQQLAVPGTPPPADAVAAGPVPWGGFFICAASIFSAWSLGSMNMALGPFFGQTLFNHDNFALSGYLVSAYLITTTLSQWLQRHRPMRSSFVQNCLLALFALALLALAVWQQWLWLALPALLLAGLGHGAAFGAGAGLLNQIAPPNHRASMVSWFYTAGYLASLWPLGVGFIIDHTTPATGLFSYLAATAVLLILILLGVRRGLR